MSARPALSDGSEDHTAGLGIPVETAAFQSAAYTASMLPLDRLAEHLPEVARLTDELETLTVIVTDEMGDHMGVDVEGGE